MEVGVHDRLDVRDQELILVANGRDFQVGAEDLAFVEAQGFNDVLVGVGVDRFFKGLAQQELAALGCGDVAVGAQHDVVGGQRVSRGEETEVALDDAALVFGQTVRVFPQRDVARHVHFLRHPVVGARGEVLFPRPFVLERHQLVDISLAVDDAFVCGVDAALFRHQWRGFGGCGSQWTSLAKCRGSGLNGGGVERHGHRRQSWLCLAVMGQTAVQIFRR